MVTEKKMGRIEKFLKKADKAIDDGIKRADEALDDAVELGGIAANQAKKTSTELRNRAMKEKKEITAKGIKKINASIAAVKQATGKTQEDLAALEKLGSLRKAGIITTKEFEEKKKKILARI